MTVKAVLALGVDVALASTGICVTRINLAARKLEVLDTALLKTKKIDILGYGGYPQFRTAFAGVLPGFAFTAATVEGVTQFGTYQTALKIQTARTAVYDVLRERGVEAADVETPRPQSWKKALLGKGNIDKVGTRRMVEANPRLRPHVEGFAHDHDRLDAFLLSLYPYWDVIMGWETPQELYHPWNALDKSAVVE